MEGGLREVTGILLILNSLPPILFQSLTSQNSNFFAL